MKRTGLLKRLRRLVAWMVLLFVLGSLALVLPLRWLDPPFSAVMLQRAWVEEVSQSYRWVSWDAIDREIALAVLAAEDQRFPDHWGLDATEILAAIDDHRDGRPLRGASTISQQVARNLYLWQGRSYLRKGLEVWFTLLLEAAWPKQRILEVYLNIAETGERMFGVGLAAEHYFGRDAADLTSRQAALLAAVLPNPRVYRADRPSAYLRERRDWILTQMRNLGGVGYLDRL
jgi:monofunctional biosynthetic peptidoglycan transglycosylase